MGCLLHVGYYTWVQKHLHMGTEAVIWVDGLIWLFRRNENEAENINLELQIAIWYHPFNQN